MVERPLARRIRILATGRKILEEGNVGCCFPAERFDLRSADFFGDFLDLFEELTPDLALLDADLPTFDAFSVLQEIRRQYFRIPVALFSENVQAYTVNRALQCGANLFVPCPFDPTALRLKIAKLLHFQD